MTACPSFSTRRDIFRTVSDVCSDIIVYSVKNPGGLTNLYADSEISLHALKNKYEQDKDELASIYQGLLNKAISKYFSNVIANVSTEVIDANVGTYKLIIQVTQNGSSVIKFNNIVLDENGRFAMVI